MIPEKVPSKSSWPLAMVGVISSATKEEHGGHTIKTSISKQICVG